MKEKFDVKLEGKEWESILDNIFNKKQKDVVVDGFRKGNVPKDIYIKKFGIESLFMDAADEALPVLYDNFMDSHKDLEVAARPNVDIKSINESNIEVTFEVVLKPEVKLGKYKDLKIKKADSTVTKEEIEHELGHLKEQFIELRVKETGSVQQGDEVTIDFEGFTDGVAFDGGAAKDYKLVIGSHSFIPGFEDGIVGMNVNEEKDIKLTFPKDYQADNLKGKEAVFKVKVSKINERVYPEMNEDFFKDLNIPDVNSEESLNKEIEKNIKSHKDSDNENIYVEDCLNEVVKNAKFDLPDEMIDEEVDRMVSEFRQQVSYQGMELEKYLDMMNSTIDDLKKNFREEAKKRVSFRLVIETVAREEKIEVSDEDAKLHTTELAKRYGTKESEFLEQIGGLEFVKMDLKMKKALEIITK